MPKSIKYLLILVQKEFKESNLLKKPSTYYTYPGFCSVIVMLRQHHLINNDDEQILINYIKTFAKTRKKFYTHANSISLDFNQFIWKYENQSSRLKWIQKEIDKY